MSESNAPFTWILQLLLKKGPDGHRSYSARQVCDFVAAILLRVGFRIDELSPMLIQIVGGFARRANIAVGAPRHEIEGAIRSYLEEHPLPVSLLQEFERRMREEAAGGSAGAFPAAFLKYTAGFHRRA